MSAEIGSYFHLTPEVIDIINNQLSGNLRDSSMFSAAVKDGQTVKFEADKSGSGTCANPGLSVPILSTPIVSPPAPALRSAPIPGDIADGYTACKHGFTPECTFCWNERRRLNGQSTVDTAEPYRNQPDEMVEFERAKQDTITLSRDDAEIVADSLETSYLEWNRRDNARLAAIFRAALEEK